MWHETIIVPVWHRFYSPRLKLDSTKTKLSAKIIVFLSICPKEKRTALFSLFHSWGPIEYDHRKKSKLKTSGLFKRSSNHFWQFCFSETNRSRFRISQRIIVRCQEHGGSIRFYSGSSSFHRLLVSFHFLVALFCRHKKFQYVHDAVACKRKTQRSLKIFLLFAFCRILRAAKLIADGWSHSVDATTVVPDHCLRASNQNAAMHEFQSRDLRRRCILRTLGQDNVSVWQTTSCDCPMLCINGSSAWMWGFSLWGLDNLIVATKIDNFSWHNFKQWYYVHWRQLFL